MKDKKTEWDIEISPQRNLFDLRIRELIEYRDLLGMFIKRDIVTVYKQTILGPLWYFLQPLLMMFIFIVVFSNIANIPTDDVPPAIFYLAGIIFWNYFSDCLINTSDVFYQNSYIFEKVYFPRMIIPFSKVVSSLIKFSIQSLLFMVIYIYLYINNANIAFNQWIVFIPFYLLIMGCLGLGLGLIVCSVTAKYRDLKFLISFATQLMMYLSPVIYPVSTLNNTYKTIMFWNPFSHILEGFRFSVLGVGDFNIIGLLYTSLFSISLLFVGLILFNKVEQSFVDTI